MGSQKSNGCPRGPEGGTRPPKKEIRMALGKNAQQALKSLINLPAETREMAEKWDSSVQISPPHMTVVHVESLLPTTGGLRVSRMSKHR